VYLRVDNLVYLRVFLRVCNLVYLRVYLRVVRTVVYTRGVPRV